MKPPITDELVYAVNEAFHDAEGAAYSGKHPEIFTDEAHRWTTLTQCYLTQMPRPHTIMDFGCGTGFVTSILARELRQGDKLIACDLSESMLTATRNLIDSNSPCFAFETMKAQPGQPLPIEPGTLDMITMNSVMHHVPDAVALIKDLRKRLRPGGVIAIGHEPNRDFFTGKGWQRYRLASLLWGGERLCVDLLGKIGLFDPVLAIASKWSAKARNHREAVQATNRALLERGLIKRPLNSRVIASILDIQSPSAGGYHPDRGLDIRQIAREAGVELDRLDTYNHLYTVSSRNRLTRAIDRRFARQAPEEGATFTAVLRLDADQAKLREVI